MEAAPVQGCGYSGHCNPPGRQGFWTLPPTCSSHSWPWFPHAGGGMEKWSDKTCSSGLLVKLVVFQACHGGLSSCVASVVRSCNIIICLKNFICGVGFKIILRLFFFGFDFCAYRTHLLHFFSCVSEE